MPTAPRRPAAADDCARELLDVVPLASRWMRAAVRRRQPSWSLPQLQALGFIRLNPGTSLSDLANNLGVGLPTASTLVSRLVSVQQVDRREDPTERRRALLRLTRKGQTQFEAALADTRSELAEWLRALPARDLARVSQAMAVLERVFSDA
jgi:DNA-binding MarR family transcriptional regulator